MEPSIKSLLCLNGLLPCAKFIEQYTHLPLIAADGAARQLLKHNIQSDLIVGDLDSYQHHPTIHVKEPELIPITSQDNTDFEKCLDIMNARNLFPTLILGLTGKEIDHTLNNLHTFMHYGRKALMMFYSEHPDAPPQYGIPVYDKYTLHASTRSTVSLLPMPEATVTAPALKWPLNRFHMTSMTRSSARNEITQAICPITVHEGQVLVIVERINHFSLLY